MTRRRLTWLVPFVLFLVFDLSVTALWAKVPPQWTRLGDRPGDRMLAAYFQAEATRLGDACLAEIKTAEDWKANRDGYRRQLLEMLGLDPLPERTDLKAAVTGRVEAEGVVVENLHFQSRPGLYVTGNLYLPKEVKEPLPAILYVCGHGGVKKNGISYGNKVHYQHHGAWFARHGYVCLTIDSLQLGEIEAIHHGTYSLGRWWWNTRGYTPAGVEAWNCTRALDYLQTRKEVDPQRLGVTGRSGGGAYSWWIAAIDERVKAAVPVAGITDVADHVVDGCVEGHCDCMFMVNTYRWDYPMVAAMVAPRALLIGNTDDDSIFPIDGVTRVYRKARRIYELCGAGDKVAMAIFPGGHADLPELQKAAFAFLDKHLKGIERDPGEVGRKLFEPEQLRVFHELPKDQVNTKIDETFTRLAPPAKVPDSQAEWDEMSQQWRKDLEEKCFRGWPEKPEPLDVKEVLKVQRRGIQLAAYDFTSQGPVRLRLFVLHRAGLQKVERVLFGVDEDDEAWRAFLGNLRGTFEEDLKGYDLPQVGKDAGKVFEYLTREDCASVMCVPRGVGPTAFNPEPKKQVQIRRRFMLLGQTLEGMQVWDVRRAIQAVRSLETLRGAKLFVDVHEKGAGLGLCASLFEPPVEEVCLVDLPPTFRQGPDLLNVCRYLDVPQLVALAAGRGRVAMLRDQVATRWEYPWAVRLRLGWPIDRLSTGILSPEKGPREEPKK